MLLPSRIEQRTAAAMAQQLDIPDSMPAHGRFADAFVIFSVTVLSMALGAWFLLQLGLSLWPGMAAALAVYTVLLLFHLLVRRSLIDGGGSEAREEMQWMAGEPELPGLGRDRRERAQLSDPIAAAVSASERAATYPSGERPHALPEASAEVAFHYRPRDLGGTLTGGRAASRPAPAATPPAGGWQDSPSPSEKNVELIQDLIKKLADELSDTPPVPTPAAPAGEAEDAMISRSLAALDTAAASMRAAAGEPRAWWPGATPDAGAPDTPSSGSPQPGTEPLPPPVAPPLPDPKLARVSEAIAANRLEVLLESIQALNEGRARHFEISSHFLAADGTAIETAGLERSGLIPRMDAARVIRAARVAHRLGERGREGTVLTSIAAESLSDRGFIDAVTSQAKAQRGMTLILSLGQDATRGLSDAEVSGLNALTAAGCGFALEDVADLNMDFAALKAAGFAFVKLNAPAFLEGLSTAANRVAASDLCRFLGDFGLTLIVARIEDDWMLARILGFGVQFGMGGLFGGPKLVKAEVVGEPAAA